MKILGHRNMTIPDSSVSLENGANCNIATPKHAAVATTLIPEFSCSSPRSYSALYLASHPSAAVEVTKNELYE